MTEQRGRAARIFAAIWHGIGQLVRAVIDTYRLGFKSWLFVPGFIAISAIPEFVQHIVEIRLGMFASRDAARALANSPLRWEFGYAKLAGLVIAMILIGRYWAVGRSWRRALLVPLPIVGRALLAIAILAAASYVLSPALVALPMTADVARSIVSMIVQTGLFAWIICILFEDRTITLARAFTERFPSAIVMTLLFFVAMLPGQFVHGLDHRFALGRPAAIVWALMTFDALVVGTLAALSGSGFYVGYRSGLTWRGWRPVDPSASPPAESGSIARIDPAADRRPPA